MTQQTNLEAVERTITVAASPERAFDVFAAELGSWWPRDYSIGEADLADFVLEPAAGGRWYEVGVDGVQCDTGRVLAFDPPERVVFAWHLNAEYQFDPDPAHASEVEVRFVVEAPDRTRVELEHRGFERHEGGAESVRGAVDGGWSYILDLYTGAFA